MLAKQHLTAESAGADVLAVIDDLVGLHATGRLSPYLQLRARKGAFTAEELADRVAATLVGRTLDARELRDAIGAAERLSAVILVMCDEGRIVR